MFERLFGRREKEREEPKVVTPGRPGTRTTPVDAERLEAQLDRLNQQIIRLMEQAGMLQEQLERVDHRTSFGNDQLEALVRHLSDVAGWAGPLDTRLAELVTWAEQSREELTQLEEAIRKLGRTQFKANTLAEAQQERLQTALETLQDLATRKQEEVEKSLQQQREAMEVARREARVAMVIDLFPALDGLEAALESGRALLERSRRPASNPGFLTRLAYAFGLLDLPRAGGEGAHALVAWLDGLALVRERFLALLQAEGIQPIRAEGKPFDPHRHVAVEAVERADVPPGTVVEEHRPGYRLGDRVLRYAEVVVNRNGLFVEEPEKSEEPEGEGPVEAWEPVVEEPPEREWTWEPQAFGEPEEETVVSAAQARPFDEFPRPEQQEYQGVPFDEALRQAQEEPQARPFDEAPQALDEPAGEMEKDTSPGTARRTVDPEIEKMIARFEERRRASRSLSS